MQVTVVEPYNNASSLTVTVQQCIQTVLCNQGKSFKAPSLANLSAASLPAMPLWPSTWTYNSTSVLHKSKFMH